MKIWRPASFKTFSIIFDKKNWLKENSDKGSPIREMALIVTSSYIDNTTTSGDWIRTHFRSGLARAFTVRDLIFCWHAQIRKIASSQN